jgi:Xaa-Pro aminopeptidase
VRQDLDRLMRERGLAGIVVFAYDRYSPAMYYATGQKLAFGVYFRAADGRAHLVHDPMERDQAAAVGCDHSSFAQHRLNQLYEEEGTPARAFGRLISQVCGSLGIDGAVGLFGDLPAGFAHALIQRMGELAPKLVVDSGHPDLMSIARTTKEAHEVRAIRHAARGAVSAIERVVEFLGSLRLDGARLYQDHGEPVTLGAIRRLIQLEFIENGLAEVGNSIVSQGRDAGVPHNTGNDHEALRPGTPLLIDIFPGEAGGGYHSDLTRTLCLGPAPDDLKRLYQDVHDAFTRAMSALELGEPCRKYQELVCDVFEQRGHATLRSKPGTEEGYCHGLGHGVGLAVHEAPRLGGPPSNTQTLEAGMIITIEPGLYYPSRGLGVRIEDLVWVRDDGTFENLTPAPYELEITPRG